MELTYPGRWLEYPSGSATFDIGDYSAHVYRAHYGPHRPSWAWWVRWEMADENETCDYEEIARDLADDAAAARAAVEAAIQQHHAGRFA